MSRCAVANVRVREKELTSTQTSREKKDGDSLFACAVDLSFSQNKSGKGKRGIVFSLHKKMLHNSPNTLVPTAKQPFQHQSPLLCTRALIYDPKQQQHRQTWRLRTQQSTENVRVVFVRKPYKRGGTLNRAQAPHKWRQAE